MLTRSADKADQDKPTARAIQERLHKIRALIRANGGDMVVTGNNKASGTANGGISKATNRLKTGNGLAKAAKPRAPRKKKDEPSSPASGNLFKVEDDDLSMVPSFSTATDEFPSDAVSPDGVQEPMTPPASGKRKRTDDFSQNLHGFGGPPPVYQGNGFVGDFTMKQPKLEDGMSGWQSLTDQLGYDEA